MQDCDFLILGGGTAGASAAAALPARASVILLEREPDFAYHSIGRSAALLVETYGPKLIQALTRASRTFFTRKSGPFGADRLSRTRGALLIAGEREETLLPELDCDFGKNQRYLVTPEECVRHVPILRRHRIEGAFFEAAALELGVDQVQQFYMQLAKSRGAKLLCGVQPDRIERRAGQWSVPVWRGPH